VAVENGNSQGWLFLITGLIVGFGIVNLLLNLYLILAL
jgi:hypothetical protein